jgi:DNA-directed RNA polymerase subunit RPC12/RpoP
VVDFLRDEWNVDELNQELVRMLCTSGTVFSRLSWEAKGGGYGGEGEEGGAVLNESSERMAPKPGYEPYYACQKCGAENSPAEAMEQMEEDQIPRCKECGGELGMQDLVEPDETQVNYEEMYEREVPTNQSPWGCSRLRLATTTTIDLPFHTKIIEDADWVKEERYVSKWDVIQAHRAAFLREENKGLLTRLIHVAGTTATGRSPVSYLGYPPPGAETELRLQHPSGGYSQYLHQRSLALYTEVWLPRKMYEGIQDSSGDLRNALWNQYPEGCRICYVDGYPVDIVRESIAETITACKPGMDSYLQEDPAFADYRDGMDLICDSVNILVQAAEHSVSEVAFDESILDVEMLRNYAAQHGTYLPVERPDGRALSDSFFRLPGADLDDAIMKFIDFTLTTIRESKGVIPALFGGGDVEPTARGAEIRRNQAMMPHNIMWGNIRRFWGDNYKKGVRMYAVRGSDKLYKRSLGEGADEFITIPNVRELEKGGLVYQIDENYPATPGQRRDWLREILQNSDTHAIFSVVSTETGKVLPQNIPLIHEAIGMDDWYIENLNAYNYIQEQIYRLLDLPPQPEEISPDGQPFQRSPIPIDPNLIDADLAVLLIRDYILSDEGRDYAEDPNSSLSNVTAYLAEWINHLEQEKQKALAEEQAAQRQQLMMQQSTGAIGEGLKTRAIAENTPPPPPQPPPPPADVVGANGNRSGR